MPIKTRTPDRMVVLWTEPLAALLNRAESALASNNAVFDGEGEAGRFSYTARWAIRLLHAAMTRGEPIDWERYGLPYRRHRAWVGENGKSGLPNHNHTLRLRTAERAQLEQIVYGVERDAAAFTALRAQSRRGQKVPLLSALMAALEYAIDTTGKEETP